MTVLLTQFLVGEFSKNYQKWSQFLFFGCNFVCDENRENFLLSTDRNVVFPQICELYTITLQPVVTEICELPPALSFAITFRGKAGWKMMESPKNQFFNKFLTIWPDLRTTFFSISKKSFFYSTLLFV